MRTVGRAALAAALLLGVPACGGGDDGGAGPPPGELSIAAREFALELPRSIPAGLTRITFRNEGEEPHALQLARLNSGVTLAQFTRALTREDENAFDLGAVRGGVASVPPGETWRLTTELEAGRYALVDYSESGGQPNFARGMAAVLEVTAGNEPAAVEPDAVGSVEMDDFLFRLRLPDGFAGKGTIELRNVGEELHELTLLRLDEGTSVREGIAAVHAFGEGRAVEPPGEVVEVLGPVVPDWAGWIELDLEPGRYLAVCLFTDEDSGRPHTEFGQIADFEVA